MKKLKLLLIILLAILAIIAPFVTTIIVTVATPPQYSESFVGILNEKYDRLYGIHEPKIIVIGGSSVAFGIDSELLEEYTGMPVVNFGLYAAIGTKAMLDLSKGGIKDSDIVIISPEMDAQTLSLYFNSSTALKAIDDDFSMFWDFDVENQWGMLGAMWTHASDKLDKMNGADASDAGIYLSKYFDEYGDFDYPREENVMSGYYDPNTPIELNVDAISEDFDEFADYLNRYIAYCKGHGATVYFSYPAMNELAITPASTAEAREEFSRYLEDAIDCDFITALDSAIMEAGYFFDTNYHLGDVGREVRTARLALDIRLAYGIVGSPLPSEKPAPPLPEQNNAYDGADEWAQYFTYEKNVSGTLTVTGLTATGKTMRELTIPLGADGLRVTSVKAGAFSGSSLEKLTVSAHAYLVRFENGSFSGTSNLRELWIYKPSGNDINPPANFLGTHSDFTVHVPPGSDYSGHYYWSERNVNFVEDAE